MSRIVSDDDYIDAVQRHQSTAEDNGAAIESSNQNLDQSDRKVIHWEPNDPENPYNWSKVTPKTYCIKYVSDSIVQKNIRCLCWCNSYI